MTAGLTRWPWWRRWFGGRSERAAARFLRGQGCRILGRNLSFPNGELDLVALDHGTLVFVEVRSTEGDDVERIAASVDAVKQSRVTKAALAYLHKHKLHDHPSRFDVVVVRWPADRRQPEIHHYPEAFEATGRFQMGY